MIHLKFYKKSFKTKSSELQQNSKFSSREAAETLVFSLVVIHELIKANKLSHTKIWKSKKLQGYTDIEVLTWCHLTESCNIPDICTAWGMRLLMETNSEWKQLNHPQNWRVAESALRRPTDRWASASDSDHYLHSKKNLHQIK